VVVLACLLAAACTRRPPPRPDEAPVVSRNFYKIGPPYQIDGIWYYPSADLNYDETGIASWYDSPRPRNTSNGEVLDMNALSAAHRTLPMPSIVQVTNLDNGRMVELRVNDRGPVPANRVISVSRRAAQLLGFDQQQTAKVRVRVMGPESIQAASLAKLNGGPDQGPVETPRAAPRDTVESVTLAPNAGKGAVTAPQAPAAQKPAQGLPVQTASIRPGGSSGGQPTIVPPGPPLPETAVLVPIRPTALYVQAGAFVRLEPAALLKARLSPLGPTAITTDRTGGIDFYRVRVGPVASVDQADALLKRVTALPGIAETKIIAD